MDIDLLSVIVRALSFITALQAAGIALLSLWAGGKLDRSRPATRRVGFVSALLTIALIVLHHLLEAGRMTGTFAGVLEPAMQRMVLHSTMAASNLLRLLGAVLLALSLASERKTLQAVGVIGAVAIALSFALTGHSAVHAQREVLAPLLVLHILLASFWFGALLPLYFASRDESASTAAALVTTFSKWATWLVPLIAIAGTLMAALLLPGWQVLSETYGLLLLSKFFGFLLLMTLAALNKWRMGPQLASGTRRVHQQFQRVVLLEYALLIGILTVTAIMTAWYSPE